MRCESAPARRIATRSDAGHGSFESPAAKPRRRPKTTTTAGAPHGGTLFSCSDVRCADGVVVTLVWSAGATYGLLQLVNVFVPLRVSKEHEMEGLDISQHGEAFQ
jgi:Ammonium Transporter Family